mgnify:FL=1
MQNQIRYPESVSLHPPYFVVHKVGDIEQGPVIARVKQAFVTFINYAVFLGKVRGYRLKPCYIGIIPDQCLIVKYKISRENR